MQSTPDPAARPPASHFAYLPRPSPWPDECELTDDHMPPSRHLSDPFEPRDGDPADLLTMYRVIHECEVRANRLATFNELNPTTPNARGRAADAASYRAAAQRLRGRLDVLVIERAARQQEALGRIVELLEADRLGPPTPERLPDDGDPLEDDFGESLTREGQS